MAKQELVSNTDSTAIERAAELRSVSPAVDILENEEKYLIEVDVPGTRDQDISINVERDELLLAAPVYGVGRHDYAFKRRFKLPDGIDRDAIAAKLEAGVLQIELPKASELRPRKIRVRAA